MMHKNISRVIVISAIGLFVVSGFITGIKLIPQQPASLVLVNQVGYLPSMQKTVLFQANDQDQASNAQFDVVAGNGTKVLANQPMVYAGYLWNNYYSSGNFTSITAPGTYEIVVHARGFAYNSTPFTIGDDVYNVVLERAVQFYYYQRCGLGPAEVVPGYVGHPPCHMDDGYWADEAGVVHWKNMSGGWHDAGDYGKYLESIYNDEYVDYSLATTYETCRSIFNTLPSLYDTPAPDIVDEAAWGARFLQKMIVKDLGGNPRVLCGVFDHRGNTFNRFGYWGPPSDETDNVANSTDDRMAGSLYTVSGDSSYQFHEYAICYVNSLEALMVAAALARTAWIMKDFHYWDNEPYNSSNLMTNATALHDDHIGMILNGTNAVNKSQDWSQLFAALDCVTELARWANYTHDDSEWARYIAEGNALRTKLVNRMDTNTSAMWSNVGDTILALVHFDSVVNGTTGVDLASLIGRYMNQTLVPAANEAGNIFNLFKGSTWIQDSAGQYHYYQYYFQYWGQNWEISTATAIAILSSNITGNKIMAQDAENNANWLMGRNPLDICQIESLGTYNLPMYHNREASVPGNPRGAEPGSVPNGIARAPPIDSGSWWRASDLPWYDMHEPNPESTQLPDFRSNELYITDNAAFLIGIATMLKYMG